MSSIPKGARIKPTHQRNPENYAIPMLDSNGDQRAAAGVIATIRNEETGALATLHEVGAVTRATLVIAAEVDRRGPAWKIISLSTPHSIYRDLQGTRYFHVDYDEKHPEGRTSSSDPRTNEQSVLGRIGRMDLLASLSPTPHSPER